MTGEISGCRRTVTGGQRAALSRTQIFERRRRGDGGRGGGGGGHAGDLKGTIPFKTSLPLTQLYLCCLFPGGFIRLLSVEELRIGFVSYSTEGRF